MAAKAARHTNTGTHIMATPTVSTATEVMGTHTEATGTRTEPTGMAATGDTGTPMALEA